MFLFYSFTTFASKVDRQSKDQVLKEISLKGKRHFQVRGDSSGQLFFAVVDGQEVKNQIPVKGVSIHPLKKGQKSTKQNALPSVQLRKIESFLEDIEIVSVVISPTQPESEVAVQANQIEIIKNDRIIDGPAFDSIGMGEGGVVSEFDFSRLKKHKQIQVLQWLDKESLDQFPDAKVIRKESIGGESFSVVVEESYTWNGTGFDKKVHLEK